MRKYPPRSHLASPLIEADIHAAVVEHLRRRPAAGLFWFHPAGEGYRLKGEAARLKGLGLTAGLPDLLLILNGHVYGVELKTLTGRISPAQRDVLARMEAAGCTVTVARGLDAALDFLEKSDLLRGRTT